MNMFEFLETEAKVLQTQVDTYAKVLDAMYLTEAGRLAFFDKLDRLRAANDAQREFVKNNNGTTI